MTQNQFKDEIRFNVIILIIMKQHMNDYNYFIKK